MRAIVFRVLVFLFRWFPPARWLVAARARRYQAAIDSIVAQQAIPISRLRKHRPPGSVPRARRMSSLARRSLRLTHRYPSRGRA